MNRRPFIALAATAAALGLLLAACGASDSGDGASSGDARTIEIEMRDIAFAPDAVDVEAGEPVRFVFDNQGTVVHDAFIGDEAAQQQHEMEMRGGEGSEGAMSEGGMDHGGSSEGEGGITVDPGEKGEITHTFEAGDELLIGCHQQGHYAAGMRITVNVT